MKLINKFLSLKNLQKLSIGIAIATIFKVFLMNNFIVNVNALTTDSGTPDFVFINQETELPETLTLNEKLPYYSNFVSQTGLNKMATHGSRPFDFNVYWDSVLNEDNSLLSKNNTTYGELTENSQFDFNNYSSVTYYMTGFNFDGSDLAHYGSVSDLQPLHRGHRYTFLFEFYQNNAFYSNGVTYNTEDFDIGMNFCWPVRTGEHDCANLKNYIDNLYVSFSTPSDVTFTNEHYAYLKVEFETNELFPADLDYDRYYALNNISVRFLNNEYQAGDVIDPDTYKYLVASNEGGTFKVKSVYMIEDYIMVMSDGDYSGIKGNNLNKTQYETCEPLDLNCHVRNIVTGIKSFTSNLISSLYKLIAYVFIPDFEEIKEIINTTKNNIFNHFPDLQALFDYLDYTITRFYNIERQTTISFPGVKLPGYDSWLIAPFTFDFNTILNDTSTSIYYIYNIGRTVLTCLIILGYSIFVYNGIKKILGSFNGGDN